MQKHQEGYTEYQSLVFRGRRLDLPATVFKNSPRLKFCVCLGQNPLTQRCPPPVIPPSCCDGQLDFNLARPKHIELADGTVISILYEDRSVIAMDKPAGWMLVPYNWDKTDRNLHLALSSSIQAGDFWARSRNLRFLRHVHRLDADTSGVLLLARSPGALHTFSRLFESRSMQKTYLAVVRTTPTEKQWTCRLRIGSDPRQIGRMKVDPVKGKDAETIFRVLESRADGRTLIEAQPVTGRTHQIRVHLAAAGYPIIADDLYGKASTADRDLPLGLRAVGLRYRDPFRKCPVTILASDTEFRKRFGFAA